MFRFRVPTALLAITIALPALAQTPAAPDASQTTEQHYKNIQVLKGIPADELIPAMRFIAGSLGVECNFCHTTNAGPEGFARDDKKEKQTAREMMKMMKSINDTSFEGRTEVTCATCHNGHSHPQGAAPVATAELVKQRLSEEAEHQHAAPGQAPAAQGEAAAKPPALPTADELFAKYEEAIGGEAAVSKLTSRHVVATLTGANGQTSKLEAFAKAPDLAWSQTTNQRFARTVAYNGKQAWAADRNTRVLTGIDAQDAELAAQFYRNLRLKDQYGMARTFRKDKLDDHDVYIVRAALKGRRFSDLLYFDANSGLLLRRTTFTRTVLGQIPMEVDFDNYQAVNGVKVAMDMTQSSPNGITKVHLDQVQFNVPVEDAKFAMPITTEQPAK